ncbi:MULTISPECIES: pyridoxamine 5'-phosphate oxidase family protein [unclassified Actinotalea]|uniref:pyridoxamine 5'-phosphate oxidase family protein n=1 Tax=unclassified Actinotalea TaxID=2638618 RepID=UPI0015F3FCCF|nr:MULTISPECIES: pyridoxamine 5'-phosphate oxidase family protein [unclassified Actinotalea]
MEDEDVAVTAWTGDPMTQDDAWDLLRTERVARLAYHVGHEVDIAPVNHVVEGGRLLFRTAPGSKLFGVVVGRTVALEVDRLEEDEARSVVVRGVARQLTDEEAEASEHPTLRSWVDPDKPFIVVVEPVHVSGRRFHLHR